MPLTAQDLIDGKSKPISVLPDQSVREAMELMIEHGFSQLPVIDPTNRPIGLVTGDSILFGIATLRMSIDQIPVKHATVKMTQFYRSNAPVLELLNEFNKHSAVLIIDDDGKLIGIITSWDTSNNFKIRAGDMYMLEDIETLLRDHIKAAFAGFYGAGYTEKLQLAIDDVTNTTEQRARDLKTALSKYNKSIGISQTIADDLFDEAFRRMIGQGTLKKTLDDLSFYEYSQLLLYKPTWASYNKYMAIPTDSLRQMLDEVRDSRNAIAHFKRDITEVERQKIKRCKQWLQEDFPPLQITEELPSSSADDEAILAVEPDFTSSDSMYAPLAKYLREQSADTDRLPMTFTEVESTLGTALPGSARTHRSWWANDSVGHVQSQQWLSVGWRVASVNMSEETVTFSRNLEREQAYISFFSTLLNELGGQAKFDLIGRSPAGDHWISVKAMPSKGPKAAWINESFTLGKRFRVELYIDTHSAERNQAIFDQLYAQKGEIEQVFGGELRWEPLETKRACRVAIYHDGSITDPAEKLTELRQWAVDATIRLERAISDKVEDALRNI